MNLRHIIIFLLSLSVLAGCKKDDLSDVDLMMEGDPIIDIDDYVAIGSEWALEAGGVTEPEEGLGYFWTLKGIVDENDTTDVFRFKFGYETGKYRLRCTAFCEGYYDNPTTKYVNVIDTLFNTSLYIGEIPGMQVFTDPRDGREYRYVTVGGTDWFITNLAYKGAGLSYLENSVMWSVFGGYYTYDEIMSSEYEGGSICPEGWHVPTEEDWAAMALSFTSETGGEDSGKEYFGVSSALMADALFCGEKIWEYSPDCEPGNESGFSALPGGYHSMGEFIGFSEYAVFWSADAYENGGLYHYIYYTDSDLKISYGTGDFRANVRCVRNSGN